MDVEVAGREHPTRVSECARLGCEETKDAGDGGEFRRGIRVEKRRELCHGIHQSSTGRIDRG